MGNKIYTKTGDKGETSLIGGTRLPKYHLRIECYGTLDELNSFVGFLRDQKGCELYNDVLLTVQDRLFTIESLLAADPQKEITRKLPQVSEGDIELLEREIDKMSELLPALNSFILPGGHTLVSTAHICRTVCRRAERKVIHLSSEEEVDDTLIRYLNRLSDYFFVLARKLALDHGIPDLLWAPKV